MSDIPLAELRQMDGEERYDYFLDTVATDREFWILVNGDNCFLKIVSEADGVSYLPVWPHEALAVDYASDDAGLTPRAVALPDFFKKWVPGLARDDLDVGVFPGEEGALWITPPEELMRDLQDVMSGAW